MTSKACLPFYLLILLSQSSEYFFLIKVLPETYFKFNFNHFDSLRINIHPFLSKIKDLC